MEDGLRSYLRKGEELENGKLHCAVGILGHFKIINSDCHSRMEWDIAYSFGASQVLIGCDGVNSKVATWLGLQSPASAGQSSIRGFVNNLYWFCTFTSSIFKYDEDEQNPLLVKQFVLNTILRNAPKNVVGVMRFLLNNQFLLSEEEEEGEEKESRMTIYSFTL